MDFPTNINWILDSTAREVFRTLLFVQMLKGEGFVIKSSNVQMVIVNEVETKYEIIQIIVFSNINIFIG